MKNINKSQMILSLVVGVMIALGSCKKKSSDETMPAPANGTLLFHLHTDADTNEVDAYGDTMTMSGGRRIAVTKAQLYISGVQLVKSDGSVIAGPSINVLKVREEEQYTIGNVASGNYESVKFNVGLSAATNGTAPSSSDPALYRKDMWFDSTSFTGGGGFVFVDFEGSIDTATVPGNGHALIPFSYRIGTNTHLQAVSMPNQNYTVTPNQVVEVHMIIDYAKLFTGIQLNQSTNLIVNTASENSTWSWATQVANNIPSMFHYE